MSLVIDRYEMRLIGATAGVNACHRITPLVSFLEKSDAESDPDEGEEIEEKLYYGV